VRKSSMRVGVRTMAAGAAAVLIAAAAVGARDAAADTVSAPIPLGAAPESPRVVAVAPNVGKVYVSNHYGNTLSVISTSDDTKLLTTILNVTHPGAIHISSDTGRVYVPDHDPSGGTLAVIDSATDTFVVPPVSTGGFSPSAVDTTPGDARIVVTNENSNSVMVLDHDLNVVASLTDPAFNKPHEVLISPAGKAYVANKGSSEVTVIDVTAAVPSVVGHIAVGADPDSMRFVGSRLWIANYLDGTISRIDTSSDTVISTVTVGSHPHGLADNPSSSLVLVANEASNTVTALSGSTGNVIPGAEAIPVGTFPQRIHITDDGKRAYVPNEGSDSVTVIDLTVSPPVAIATLDNAAGIGAAPSSLAVLGHSKVYVANKNDNTVSVITIQEAAAAPPSPTSTSSPVPTRTAPPTETPAPTDTPAPDTVMAPPDNSSTAAQSDSPADPGTPPGAAAPSPQSGVAGANAAPSTGTPSAAPSRTAKATVAAGSIAQDTGAATGAGQSAAGSARSGGAPSWIWLAASLGVMAVAGVGGYGRRNQIAALLSRMKR